jgi:hypothetical protein
MNICANFTRRVFIAAIFLSSCAWDKHDRGEKSNLQDRVGNGGSVVVNGVEYSLADLYFKPHGGDSFTFDDRLRGRLKLLQEYYGKWHIGTHAFFAGHIFSELVQYYFTATLPAGCDDPVDTTTGIGIQFACTKGFVTWIIPEYFIKLPLEQRVAAIIHERLHAFVPSQPHEVISPFVKGTVVFQTLYGEDGTAKKWLQDEEVSILDQMRFAARQIGFDESVVVDTPDLYMEVEEREIHPYGGGFTSKSDASPDAYIALDSVALESIVSAGAEVTDSFIYKATLGSGSVVSKSTLFDCLQVEENAIIEDSQLTMAKDCGEEHLVEKGAKIVHSTITSELWDTREGRPATRPFRIGSDALIQDTWLAAEEAVAIESGARIVDSKLFVSKLTLGKDVKISSSTFTTSSDWCGQYNCNNGSPIEILGGEIINSTIDASILGMERGTIRNSTIKAPLAYSPNTIKSEVPIMFSPEFSLAESCNLNITGDTDSETLEKAMLSNSCQFEVVPR